MLIPIPYAMKYTATVSGATLKFVTCEKCSCQFVYRMTRVGEASATDMFFLEGEAAAARVAESAQSSLQSKLDRSFEPVPCLDCGCYQSFMIPRLRKSYRRWMTTAGVALIAIASLLTSFLLVIPRLATLALWSSVGAGGILGLALPLVRLILANRYDPNSGDPEPRKKLAQECATRREELNEMLEGARCWAKSLEGLPLVEAAHRAENMRFLIRVVIDDGVCMPVGTEMLPERVSVVVRSGIVTNATIG